MSWLRIVYELMVKDPLGSLRSLRIILALLSWSCTSVARS